MIDLHSHICYGIDDGSKSIEESIELLKHLANNGTTDLFLTPHYIEDSKYNANQKKVKAIIDELNKYIEEEKINIKLYIGNEVYLTPSILELLKKKKISTLNNSKYILVEFPMFIEDHNARSILHVLLTKGYIPIVAHPERYQYLEKNMQYFKDLQELGVQFQGNYLSLFGKYGKHAKKNLQNMLKQGIISYLGSDIHHMEELHYNKLYKEIKKYVKKDEKVMDLLENNARVIIDYK